MKFRLNIVLLITLGFSCQKETTVTVSSVDIWTGTKIEVKAGQIIMIAQQVRFMVGITHPVISGARSDRMGKRTKSPIRYGCCQVCPK